MYYTKTSERKLEKAIVIAFAKEDKLPKKHHCPVCGNMILLDEISCCDETPDPVDAYELGYQYGERDY